MPAHNHYAIGLKGWVQIRTAAKPPTLVISEAELPAVEFTRTYIPGTFDSLGFPLTYGHWGPRQRVETPLPIKLYVYEGGRTIRTLKSLKFRVLTGLSVRENQLKQLDAAHVKRLKGQ